MSHHHHHCFRPILFNSPHDLHCFCRAFSHPAKFMSYIGLDQKPVQPSSADTCGINRSHVSTPEDVDPTLPSATTGLNSLTSLLLCFASWPGLFQPAFLLCTDCKKADMSVHPQGCGYYYLLLFIQHCSPLSSTHCASHVFSACWIILVFP